MTSKKTKISIIVLSIILVISIVSVTFAIGWDSKTQDIKFGVNVGTGVNMTVTGVTKDNGLAGKVFAPINANDITDEIVKNDSGKDVVTFAKIGYFTLQTEQGEANVVAVDVIWNYTIKAGTDDLSNYVDFYLVKGTDYDGFTTDFTKLKAMTPNSALPHSRAGERYGIVIKWKDSIVNAAVDSTLVKKIVNKDIHINLSFEAKAQQA